MDPDANLAEQLKLAGDTLMSIDHLAAVVAGRIPGREPEDDLESIEDFYDLIHEAQHAQDCSCSAFHRNAIKLQERVLSDADCTCGAWRAARVIRDLLDDLERLSQLVEGLDLWILGSGFLPMRWRRP